MTQLRPNADSSTPSTPPASLPPDSAVLASVTAELLASFATDGRIARLSCGPADATSPVPSTQTISELIDLLRRLVFIGFFEAAPISPNGLTLLIPTLMARVAAHLREQIEIALRYASSAERELLARASATATPACGIDPWAPWPRRLAATGLVGSGPQSPSATADLAAAACESVAAKLTDMFLQRLIEVRRMLSLDVQAAFDGDPAAEHTDEIVLCYPGMLAIFHHRLAHELYRLGVPLLPRIISEQAHRHTGIDIHPGAIIGERFFVDHGAGTVIGETARIGRDVKIYQGVTLGAKSFDKDNVGSLVRATKRHPTIGDRVTIYAGAVILGGDTEVGDDCVINGGVFLTMGVPNGHVVRQNQAELTMRAVRVRGDGARGFEI